MSGLFTLICTAIVCLHQPITVYDGDTVKSDGHRWRLWGITAPERYAPGGLEAKMALIAIIGDQPLGCVPRGTSFDRTVVQCWLPGGEDVACALVKSGHAADWPTFSNEAYRACVPAARP